MLSNRTPLPDITPRSWLMVACLGLVWGSTFLVIEIALRGITPLWLAAARISFAGLLTLGIWQLRGRRLFLTADRPWGAFVLIGVLSTALPFTLLSWGQQFVSSGFAGVCMAAVALMVLPLAHVFLPGERMSLRRTAGFVTGFAGVSLLLGGQSFASSGAALEPLGRLACLGAAGCYAVSSVTVRRLPPMDPIGIATIPMIFGTVMIVPFAWVIEGPPPLPSAQTLGVLMFLGLVPTAAANLLRVLVIRSAGPVFMSLTNYQVPLWSVVLGVLLLGEPMRLSLLGALALILLGVAISQWGALKRLFRPAR